MKSCEHCYHFKVFCNNLNWIETDKEYLLPFKNRKNPKLLRFLNKWHKWWGVAICKKGMWVWNKPHVILTHEDFKWDGNFEIEEVSVTPRGLFYKSAQHCIDLDVKYGNDKSNCLYDEFRWHNENET